MEELRRNCCDPAYARALCETGSPVNDIRVPVSLSEDLTPYQALMRLMEDEGLDYISFARVMEIPTDHSVGLVRGDILIDEAVAKRLEVCFGHPAAYWLRIQEAEKNPKRSDRPTKEVQGVIEEYERKIEQIDKLEESIAGVKAAIDQLSGESDELKEKLMDYLGDYENLLIKWKDVTYRLIPETKKVSKTPKWKEYIEYSMKVFDSINAKFRKAAEEHLKTLYEILPVARKMVREKGGKKEESVFSERPGISAFLTRVDREFDGFVADMHTIDAMIDGFENTLTKFVDTGDFDAGTDDTDTDANEIGSSAERGNDYFKVAEPLEVDGDSDSPEPGLGSPVGAADDDDEPLPDASPDVDLDDGDDDDFDAGDGFDFGDDDEDIDIDDILARFNKD